MSETPNRICSKCGQDGADYCAGDISKQYHKGCLPSSGWMKRQMDFAAEQTSALPDWMKREAGLKVTDTDTSSCGPAVLRSCGTGVVVDDVSGYRAV